MGVSFETYLRRHWDIQRDIVTTSLRRLVAGWGEIMLNRAIDYYENDKERLREQARKKYANLSEEGKEKKREYGKNRYRTMSEEKKQKLKEYKKQRYRKAKKSRNNK